VADVNLDVESTQIHVHVEHAEGERPPPPSPFGSRRGGVSP
jgi:hypothetical protein